MGSGIKGISSTQSRMSSYLLGAQLFAWAIRYSGSAALITQVSLNDLSVEQFNNLYYSFNWGYAAALLPTAVIVNRCNPRLLLASALVLSSIFHLFVPLVAKLGFVALMLCRIATGLCQGCILPSTFVLMAQWIPRSFRARLGGMIISANLLAYALLNIIFKATESSFNPGNFFYIFGGTGIFFGIVFYAMSVNYSSDHVEEPSDVNTNFQKLKIPWKSILTSQPVWAIIIAHCACTYGNLTYLNIVSSYIFLKTAGFIPVIVSDNIYIHIGMWFLNIFVSMLVEPSTRQIIPRKICNSIGTLVPAVMLVILVLTKPSYYLINVISTFGTLFRAIVYFGYFLNVLELCPNFVGVIVAIMEFFSAAVSLLLQHSIQYCYTVSSSVESGVNIYFIVICIGAAAYSLSNVIFLIFCTTEVQKWNGPIGSLASGENQLSSVAVNPKHDIRNRETSH